MSEGSAETKRPSILVVGSMNMDLVLQVDRIPQAGESYFGSEYRYIPGGKGANQAAAAALLGADVTFVGRVGADAHGEKLVENLAGKGIDTELIVRDAGSPSGLAVIVVEPSGENRIMVYPGSNARISEEDLPRAFERSYDAVLVNLEIPEPIVRLLVEKAGESATPVILDAGPPGTMDLSALGHLHVLSPNETETEAITGMPCSTVPEAAAAAERLARTVDVEYVVLKLGKRGALLYHRGESELIDTYPVKAIDTTAAGDAFTAALAVRLLSGSDIRSAVRYGNAAGALCVTKLGAQTSLPGKAETDRFFKENEQGRA